MNDIDTMNARTRARMQADEGGDLIRRLDEEVADATARVTAIVDALIERADAMRLSGSTPEADRRGALEAMRDVLADVVYSARADIEDYRDACGRYGV